MVRMPLDSCIAGPPVVVTGSGGGGVLGSAWGWRTMAPYMDGPAGGVKLPPARTFRSFRKARWRARRGLFDSPINFFTSRGRVLVADPLRHPVVGAEIAEPRDGR